MGQGDCWALFRSLQSTYSTSFSSAASHGKYDLRRALGLYNETRRHFLGRVELQMSLDVKDAAYVAAAGNDEGEWIRRVKETHKNQVWLTEHDVEAEFLKTLSGEAHWSQETERPEIEEARP
jgi:salicylate hydroxylase